MPQPGKPSRVDRCLRRTAPWGTQVGKLDGTAAAELLRLAPVKWPVPDPSGDGSLLVDYSRPSGGSCPAPRRLPP